MNWQRYDRACPPEDYSHSPKLRYSLPMAKRTQVILIDDLSGETIPDGEGETVSFGLDGASYSIDLTAENAAALRDALAPYLKVGNRSGRAPATSSRRTQGSSSSTREIRDWARSNGMKVPDRGRIPREVREAFESRDR